MDKSTSNQKVLNITYQTASMGVFACDQIYGAIKDQDLIMLVLKQRDKYAETLDRSKKLSLKYGLNISDLNCMLKAMSFASIKMKSTFDNTTGHLSEMLIQGTTMGITSLLKVMGENDSTDEKIRQNARDLQTAMEEFVDSLKVLLVNQNNSNA